MSEPFTLVTEFEIHLLQHLSGKKVYFNPILINCFLTLGIERFICFVLS